MSDKKVKNDPLLGEDEVQAEAPEEVSPATEEVTPVVEEVTPAVVEAKPATVSLHLSAKVKAEAIAKFPNDPTAQTKYILDNSQHIDFIIPQLEGEMGHETVQINGYKLTIQKNVMVNIPVQVAQLIAEKYKINMEAGKGKRTDRSSDVADALG